MQDPSDEMLDALWLTALRWDDPALESIADTLPTKWLERAGKRRRLVSGLPGGAKARALREVASRLEASLPSNPALPPRALTLLCSEVDGETGRRWAAAAPSPRRGFSASPGLRRWLRRLARDGDA